MLGASCLPGREGSRVNREFLVPRQSVTFWKRSRERSFVFKNKRDGSPFSGKLCTLRHDLCQQHHHTAMQCFPGTCPQVMEFLPLLAPHCPPPLLSWLCPGPCAMLPSRLSSSPALPLHLSSHPTATCSLVPFTALLPLSFWGSAAQKRCISEQPWQFERQLTCLHTAHAALKSVSHQEGPKPACPIQALQIPDVDLQR